MSTVCNKYIYLLMRQRRLQHVHILTDASAQPPTSTYTYWSANSLQQVNILTDASSLQQVHILSDASAVYNKYIYLLMRQHSLQQVHIPTDASTQSTTSTYTYQCVSTVYSKNKNVHILTDAPTQSTSTYTYWCVNTVYNKYIYLLIRQHSLQHVHILTDAST